MNGETNDNLSDPELELIKVLREEASTVKDCFTKFSFQALAISTAVIGFVATKQQEQPLVALVSVFVFMFMLVVIRIGTYKYGTANRNFGYELHLHSALTHKRVGVSTELIEATRKISWEEAMRAWRVVQAGLFEHLCPRRKILHFRAKSWLDKHFPDFGNELAKGFMDPPSWFTPDALARANGAEYYAGSYLERMMAMLTLAACLSLTPMVVMLIQMIQQAPDKWPAAARIVAIVSGAIVLGICLFFLVVARRRNINRLKLLESGILSIHGCCILWHAVVIAHARAQKQVANSRAFDLDDIKYLKALAEQAVKLKTSIAKESGYTITAWLAGSD